ncbi:MAG: hypothetical protein ACOCRO_04420 [Halanaerobiales bacterium]
MVDNLRDVKITNDGTVNGTTVELDGEVVPYVTAVTMHTSIDYPIPSVDLSINLNAFTYEGKAEVNLGLLHNFDEDLARELYNRLKDFFESVDNE